MEPLIKWILEEIALDGLQGACDATSCYFLTIWSPRFHITEYMEADSRR